MLTAIMQLTCRFQVSALWCKICYLSKSVFSSTRRQALFWVESQAVSLHHVPFCNSHVPAGNTHGRMDLTMILKRKPKCISYSEHQERTAVWEQVSCSILLTCLLLPHVSMSPQHTTTLLLIFTFFVSPPCPFQILVCNPNCSSQHWQKHNCAVKGTENCKPKTPSYYLSPWYTLLELTSCSHLTSLPDQTKYTEVIKCCW